MSSLLNVMSNYNTLQQMELITKGEIRFAQTMLLLLSLNNSNLSAKKAQISSSG